VDFNPITGRLVLENLNVISGGQPVLKLPLAVFDIEWAPLVRKRVVLKLIAIKSLELTVQALEDGGMQIGGIKLPDKPDKEETSEPSTWDFGLLQVTVKNSKVKFISPQLSSDLKIEELAISKLRSWLPERSTDLEFKGQLNDGNLQFQMDVTPFASDIAARGQIKLIGLTLTPFAQLLKPQINALEGRFDVDLNIETRQGADGGFSHRQKGLLKLSQIRTQIKDTEFSNESLAWDGAVQVNIPKSGEALKISTDGKLNGSKLSMTAKNANLQIQQEQLNWEGKVNVEQTPAAVNLNADSTLSLQNTGVNAPDVKLTEEKLNWKGTVQLSIAEKAGEQHIIVDGNLASGPLTVILMQQNLNLTHAGLDWQGKFDYALEKTSTNINTDGQMQLLELKMESPEANLAEEKLTWKGALQFFAPADAGGQRVITDGTIDGNHLQADLPGRKLKLGHQGLSWKGRLDSGETNDFSSLKAEADFSLKDIEILQSETSQHLFNLGQADFRAIQIEGLDKIKVSGIALNGLALLAELKSAPSTDAAPSLLRMQALEVKDIQLSQHKDLAIESINLKALKIFVHRDSEGKLPAIERLNAVKSDVSSTDPMKPAASDTKTKAKSSNFGFRIGQFDIGGESGLRFKDESISPAFSIDLSLLEARLADLDNRRPQKPATIKLLISDGEDGRLSLDGTMKPFGEQVNLNWTGKIESLALPPLSPYVIQNTGYRFVSGQMEADIPVTINQNQIDGKIDLIIYNPTVERVKSEAPPEEKQGKIQIGMPLDSALNLMRDKQNNVRLKIPISGNINDPKFSVADAINKVLAQALQKSAVSYLKYMLGPYGLGIAAVELAIDGTSKIRLNPIPFAPGSDELDEAANDYLERVAAIMKEHPEVQVVVCGVATESDRESLGASTSTTAEVPLLKLAKNRTKRIKDQLVKLHGIEAKRIVACEPKIDNGAEAKPRADLEI
jgi:outer membrane protein OmpA-like peptidoglycan-associated protein